MSEMTPKEFAAWKRGHEERILRIREDTEGLRRQSEATRLAAEEFRRKADEQAEKDRLAAEEFRRKADEQAEKDRLAAEKRSAEADRRMKKIEKSFGGWTNNASEHLEDEFVEALEEAMQVGGIALDEVFRRMRKRYEFDLVGINGDAVVVGEIKRKLLPEDVRHFAKNRLPYFAENFPMESKGRKIYGMVCGEIIVDDAVTEAVKLGLFVLRLKNKKLLVENVDTACPVN